MGVLAASPLGRKNAAARTLTQSTAPGAGLAGIAPMNRAGMQRVAAIAIPMDVDLLGLAPTSPAWFIRRLGCQGIPCVNDTAQSVPFAIDAGLGELSRLNKLVTPKYRGPSFETRGPWNNPGFRAGSKIRLKSCPYTRAARERVPASRRRTACSSQ